MNLKIKWRSNLYWI